MSEQQSEKRGVPLTFLGWDCYVQVQQYRDGATALELVEQFTGDDVATATVNLPDYLLEPTEVFIKDYSENEGMLRALIDAGIVEPTGEVVETGYVRVPHCRIIHPKLVKELTPPREREPGGDEQEYNDEPF